jgi:hypothetical protein
VIAQGEEAPPTPNRLIWADNLPLMVHLLAEYEGKIDLIYADPPFFTDRTYAARIGHGRIRAVRRPGSSQKDMPTSGKI